ncbi:ABC transporter permease [Thalassovita mangrovi]|uniref:FtsX-like permease family protein n=1 Tax=Thalassovita mangrovi TaxID=2692236 RepID=A0A6L8LED8_9RHOB|nr:FtsX-like permease family protein [Thalassovita mangrovi]MYM54424.1 FtsX-like permease family protein [Thalassovita mangrovi]
MVSPLDRKLFRDLARIKGQAAAIGVVIALGVMMLVMMTGLVNTLDETRRAYYDRYRLADVFAPVTRAPERMADRIAALPGVAAVQSRVAGAALIDMAKGELPVRAQALSLPDIGLPRLNDIFLTSGRLPEPGRSDEIVLLEGFAKARGLKSGDKITATMNGAKRQFRITGFAQSPEFLYSTAPGEIVPDDARFAVFWMRRAALGAAYDMEGAFSEVLVALTRGTNPQSVISAADLLLAPYGAAGAYDLKDLFSNRFISEEIRGLRVSTASIPPIFLGVAAFLLYIVISRMVRAEREQIGLLKAFGYTSWEVSFHYLKLVLVIAVLGAIVGSIAGVAAGSSLAVVYQLYYKFPFLVFTIDPRSFVIGFGTSILTASVGSLFVLRGVFKLTPAVAMRPPTPPDYSRAFDLAGAMKRWLDQPARMVLRRISRYPGRMLGASVGIACGLGLSAATLTMMAGFDTTIDLSFTVLDRSDMTVVFTDKQPPKALLELGRMPGVLHVEPIRVASAVLRNGTYSYRGSIEGRPELPVLNRVIDTDFRQVPMRREGLILSQTLADILHVTPGDWIEAEIREGRRPVLRLPVIGTAQTLTGAPAYMELGALSRALQEPEQVSGAYLTIDANRTEQIFERIKGMPRIAGATLKEDARNALVEIMNTGPASVRFVMLAVAAVITFGIVYNAARIALAERMRDLASLRVMGFTSGETSFVLLGELGAVTLVALPLGSALGYGLTYLMVKGFSTDIYQIPAVFSPSSHGTAVLAVLVSAAISGWLVKRDLDRADLVEALKTRE